MTGHRAMNQPLDLDWPSLASEDTTLVVYMGAANIAEIARQLIAQGLPEMLPVLAIASATTPRERRIASVLGTIAADVALADFDAPLLFIIGHVVSLYQSHRFYDLLQKALAEADA